MKRFTICVVLFGFIVVSLLITRPALTDQQSEKKTVEPTKMEQLQKERIDALEKIAAIVKGQLGYIATVVDFSKAQEEVIKAKLDATDKPSERIALLEEQLKFAQDAFKYVDGQYKTGFAHVTEADSLHAKAHCLTIEIKLLKEHNDKKM
jgi:hypothetical protein